MRRFVFRLENVLRIRQFELDRARASLGELEAEHARRAERVADALARLERGRLLLAEDAEAGVDGQRLAMRADGVSGGRYALAIARRAVLELEAPLVEARERVRAASVRVRSLERLREKRAAQHRHEFLSAEQAELEELARSSALSNKTSEPGEIERSA